MQVLSNEWLVAVDAALASIEVDPDRHVVIGQEVTDAPTELVSPGGGQSTTTLRYRLVVGGGRARLVVGDEPPADVTITTPWPLALEIASGASSAQHAFLRGDLRIGGDPRLLIEHAEVAAAVSRVAAGIR
jgi:predicted lipid carrier protein YhbT